MRRTQYANVDREDASGPFRHTSGIPERSTFPAPGAFASASLPADAFRLSDGRAPRELRFIDAWGNTLARQAPEPDGSWPRTSFDASRAPGATVYVEASIDDGTTTDAVPLLHGWIVYTSAKTRNVTDRLQVFGVQKPANLRASSGVELKGDEAGAADGRLARALLDGKWHAAGGPVTKPFDHDMAYDASRGVVVMFGGKTVGLATEPFNDTWEYDGTTWERMRPVHRPPRKHGHSLVYDAARGHVLLDTGATTWSWDGEDWTPLHQPTPRQGAAVAYYAGRRVVVLIGGEGPEGPLDDVWEWDGQSWEQSSVDAAPPAQTDASLAYDRTRYELVWLGKGQTWLLRSGAWTPVETVNDAPSPGAELTFDRRRQSVVAFGGADSRVWVWSGNSWEPAEAGPPPARVGQAWTYDGGVGALLTLGGVRSDSWPADPKLGDTWLGRETEWQDVTGSPSPQARTSSGLVFDSVRQKSVLFGGQPDPFGAEPLGDTWEFSSEDGWTEVPPPMEQIPALGPRPQTPTPRRDFAMADDEARPPGTR